MLGLNPVDDSVESVTRVLERFQEVKTRWSIPTQTCVLAHVTTQMECIRQGAPADLIFQSIAGSQKGNEAFGFTADTIAEARAAGPAGGHRHRAPTSSTSRPARAPSSPARPTTAGTR